MIRYMQKICSPRNIISKKAGSLITYYKNYSMKSINTEWMFIKSLALTLALVLTIGAPGVVLGATNLVQNGDFETEDSIDPTIPSNWQVGFSTAEHAATYTYPSEGFGGTKGVRIQIDNTQYVNGDSKWLFNDVAVESGKIYQYEAEYKSNVESKVYYRYNKGNCPAVETDCAYDVIATLAAATDWTKFKGSLTIPEGVTSVTLFHAIVGDSGSAEPTSWLEIDNVSLEEDVPAEVVDNVPNPSVEEEGTDGQPKDWTHAGYGTNTPLFEYVQDEGYESGKSVKVTISGYESGDAKWVYATQPITGGEDYHFSAWYKVGKNNPGDAAVIPNVVVEYTDDNGAITYFGMPRPEPAEGESWQLYENEFSVPSNVRFARVFLFLTQNGWLQTDDYHVTDYEYEGFNRPLVTLTFDDGYEENVNTVLSVLASTTIKTTQCYASGTIHDGEDVETQRQNILTFLNNGHEICSHTVTHPDLTTLTSAELTAELANSKAYLEELIGASVPNFASPFGAYNASVISEIRNHYGSHRTVDEGFNSEDNLDLYRLKVQNMTSNTTLAEFKEWVNKAKQEDLWLIIVYHKVTDNPANLEQFDTMKSDFEDQMEWLVTQDGITIKTLADAIAEVTSPDPVAPTLTFSGDPLTITAGGTTTLTWDSTDAATCDASNGWTGVQAVDGSIQVSPLTTTTYTLTCTGAGGDITSSVTITVEGVTPEDPDAPTLSFTVAPNTIQLGEVATLSWTSTNATTCTASNGWTGAQSINGSLQVSPIATTTYALTCTGEGGEISNSVTLAFASTPVIPEPEPEPQPEPTPEENDDNSSSPQSSSKSRRSSSGSNSNSGEVLGASTTTPAAPAQAYVFARDLGYGAMGADVTELQKLLTAKGFYKGPITGTFGLLTKDAVIAYQTANGIFASGFVGPITRAALNKEVGVTPMPLSSNTAELEALLAKLKALYAQLMTKED